MEFLARGGIVSVKLPLRMRSFNNVILNWGICLEIVSKFIAHAFFKLAGESIIARLSLIKVHCQLSAKGSI